MVFWDVPERKKTENQTRKKRLFVYIALRIFVLNSHRSTFHPVYTFTGVSNASFTEFLCVNSVCVCAVVVLVLLHKLLFFSVALTSDCITSVVGLFAWLCNVSFTTTAPSHCVLSAFFPFGPFVASFHDLLGYMHIYIYLSFVARIGWVCVYFFSLIRVVSISLLCIYITNTHIAFSILLPDKKNEIL